MTEIVPAIQDEVKKDSSQPPSSPKSKMKALNQANDANERPKTNEKMEKPPTKVVVRRLPPTMTLETFLDQVAPLPPVDYMYFVNADFSLAPNSFSRAYLHFVHVADLLIFTEKFDNYVFVDSKGNEYPAIVEYSPFQRIPKQRSSRKKDPRVGTIENDPYYQEFIEALQAEETQRKSASKTNKQHFFETSTSSIVTKVTSTPLLEFLKAKRADKLRTKEDKIAERRKREIERRKAREDTRVASKQIKAFEEEVDAAQHTTQIKIAGHGGVATDKLSKETLDIKRSLKENSAKDLSKRREEERYKVREKEKDRRDREKEVREAHRDLRRDIRKDSTREQGSVPDKDKENQPSTAEVKSKEARRGGKSYQEERQRLNERRLAAKGLTGKPIPGSEGSDKPEKGGEESCEVSMTDKQCSNEKDSEPSFDSRGRPHEKMKNPDQHRLPNSRDSRKYDKLNKPARESEQRRNYEVKKSLDERYNDDGKNTKKNNHTEKNAASDGKIQSSREETQKKSYNQERELRRAAAADRKNQTRRDSTQSSKGEEKPSVSGNVSTKTETLEAKEFSNHSMDKQHADIDRCESGRPDINDDDLSKTKSVSDVKSQYGKEPTDSKKKEISTLKDDEKTRKDPRTERRIRNKDRPSIEIYRPGMGRFSRQRLEREKGLNKGSSTERDSPSSSPSPVPSSIKTVAITENSLVDQ